MSEKHIMEMEKYWAHKEFGDVEVLGAGHFPDTVTIKCLEGEYQGDVFETPILELISTRDSNAALNLLLTGLIPGKG